MKTLFDFDITLEEAEELIKNGADVNEKDHYAETPLFYILRQDIAELLIKSGANVNEKNFLGQTPLHKTLSIEKIEFLLSHGAHINTKDGYGLCILDYTLDLDIIKFIIDRGALCHVKTYKINREYFSVEQQKASDAFLLLTNDNELFFQMCLAYQEGLKNYVKIDIKNMDIL